MSLSLGGGVDLFFERRLRLALIVVATVFGVFFLRLFQLQILEGAQYRLRSEENSIHTLRLEAPRGEILDRDRRVLATTRPAFDLELIPRDTVDPARTLWALGSLLGEPSERLRERLGEPQGRARFQPVRLAEDLSWEELARVESHRHALPGVFTEVRPVRHYPHGSVAAHALGTVGEIDSRQLESGQFLGYRAGEQAGRSGVEALLESHLRGRAGGRNVVVDVAGREVELLEEVEPLPGGRAVLTLDLDLQLAAEEGFAPLSPDELPPSGAVVALDPRTGEVLALASMPGFDPNRFATRLDAKAWEHLANDPSRPLQNRAIAGQYAPASAYKPFVAAAAMAEGVIEPADRVFCPGFFRLGRRTYRCWRRAGHGPVDLHAALVQSCDIYFYRVGLELGVDRLARLAREFGLGSLTGFALGVEAGGLVPTSGWKERRFGEPWVAGETLSAAIGQGFNLVTPLQLAVAYAALVNGGSVLRPFLVRRLEGARGTAEASPGPKVIGRVPIAPQHLARVRNALRAAVEDKEGTGGRARVPGVAVAGKTGTAQVVRLKHTERLAEEEIPRELRDHGWFAAFAPADVPEIVVVVLVEHGGTGGSVAAPIAQRVLERYFEKRGRGVEVARVRRLGGPAVGRRGQAEATGVVH